MPKKAKTPADLIYEQALARLKGVAQKMQQPSDDNRLKAQILGGLGGVMEQFIPRPEDQLVDSAMPAAMMVRQPAHLVKQFSRNFINQVPQQLEDEGQTALAYQFEDMARKHPQWFGQLEQVIVDPKLESHGSYISDVLALPSAKIGLDPEKRAAAGLLPASNNAIVVNPKYVAENNPGKTSVPNVWDPTKQIAPLEARRLTRHESKHLGQDTENQLLHTKAYPYWVHPDEVEARIFEKDMVLDPQSIMLELANGRQRAMTELTDIMKGNMSDPIVAQEYLKRKNGLKQSILSAAEVLQRRLLKDPIAPVNIDSMRRVILGPLDR